MEKRFKVFLRLRPTSKPSPWHLRNGKLYHSLANHEQDYPFLDHVFQSEDTTTIYNKFIKNSIVSFMNGRNCTIFAYGQTGSGKTYTMLGNNDGLIIRSLETIFEIHNRRVKESEQLLQKKLTSFDHPTFSILDDGTVQLEISYIEIYNEQVYDLINKSNKLRMYTVKEKLVFSELTKIKIKTLKDAIGILVSSEKNRRISCTEFNKRSSRSHTLFRIEYSTKARKSILNLIDLAGSEKAASTRERRMEGAYINRSLLALSSMVESLIRGSYTNFRNSKLTRILQESIDSDVELISFCTADTSCVDETLGTLNFASRMTQIKRPKINRMSKEDVCPTCHRPYNESSETEKSKDDLQASIEELSGKIAVYNEKNKRESVVFNEERILLQKRIRVLEAMFSEVLADGSLKKLTEIYLLEKNIYNLQYDLVKKRLKSEKID